MATTNVAGPYILQISGMVASKDVPPHLAMCRKMSVCDLFHLRILPACVMDVLLSLFLQLLLLITMLSLDNLSSFETKAPFLDLNLSITNGIVSSKIYDKQDDFNFEIVNFPFLDGDVPRSPSYGVYISQLIRFARVCSNFEDFNNRNLFLTAKLLKQGYRYHKIRKAFSKFYHRHS